MYNPIGENLKAAREYLDLTINQVASILDISAYQIKAYEVGTSIPDSKTIIKFSDLYGISCLDILTKHDFNKSKDEKAIADLIKFKNELKKIDFYKKI